MKFQRCFTRKKKTLGARHRNELSSAPCESLRSVHYPLTSLYRQPNNAPYQQARASGSTSLSTIPEPA
ncbi:hypothetical protein VTI28DRAFT_3237 [Corynascus sepedonium]